ncbi:hypothetical protein B0H14DRAFT_2610424 [Mycena olivaceomarginata]|nr:hypothetical protein B0H14DRAFT_2610424 [Mycena olivaceomarginata]
MDGNPPPPPPVQLVRTYKRVPQLPIPTIESIRAKGASSTSNSPVALSPLSASTQISLRAPKRTCWQKIDNTARLVGDRIYCRVGKLTQKKCTDARKRRHLRATTNKRTKNTEVIEWEDIAFSVEELAALYQDEDKYMWYVAGPRARVAKSSSRNTTPSHYPSGCYQLLHHGSEPIYQQRPRIAAWIVGSTNKGSSIPGGSNGVGNSSSML